MKSALSIDEVRAETGIGRTRIYEAINAGALKAKTFGRRTYILRADLESFLCQLPAKNVEAPKKPSPEAASVSSVPKGRKAAAKPGINNRASRPGSLQGGS